MFRKSPSSGSNTGTGHTVPNPTNTDPNITRLHGLLAEVKMEADLLQKKGETVWATISQSRIRVVGEPVNKTDEEQQDKCEPPTRDITIAEFCNTGQKTSW